MSQLLLTPHMHSNTYPNLRHESANTLKSCGIPCAVWGEDLWHFGVPTIIFDHFMLVPNPETAASKLESLGFHPLLQIHGTFSWKGSLATRFGYQVRNQISSRRSLQLSNPTLIPRLRS